MVPFFIPASTLRDSLVLTFLPHNVLGSGGVPKGGNEGLYRIVDLRPGLYTVTFTLPGFRTFKREGIELTTGFTAIVNGEMNVGTIEETVTVTGASPVVDTQNVIQQTTISRAALDALPTPRRPAQFITLIPAANAGGTNFHDVGGAGATEDSSASTVSVPMT